MENSLHYHHHIKVGHRNVLKCIACARDICICKVTTAITTHSTNSRRCFKIKCRPRGNLKNTEGKQTWIFISLVNVYFNCGLVKPLFFFFFNHTKVHRKLKVNVEERVSLLILPAHMAWPLASQLLLGFRQDSFDDW